MKLAIIGYGKMGKTIEKIALDRGHEIVNIVEERGANVLKQLSQNGAEVAIEFSQPEAAAENIKACIDQKVKVVSGTTGWLDKMDEIKKYAKQKEGTFFYASNYSVGVNLFFHLNEWMANLMSRYSDYNVKMEEIHHTEKKDAPSGTAITLAEGIVKNHPDIQNWKLFEGDNVPENSPENIVPILSKRIDPTPGTHEIIYKSDIDEISIKHTAHSRTGFALGAVLVAEWIKDKQGILTMKDFLPL
ncbi:4-hydroxy-tetrahydrodipicolinate reductase [Mangrovivirga cuniculi]|uniref:4-hydroxy-tetrahydrodipicolinate reductase n=1 Tax=Mangrovivirga cuniculi TaxID=2715131 RepID=A0A4D7JV29_9BACT|nr:4-hydroxy-tetrahydrodipicolinate reductase [Mangrovivirga cuniculi]QCK16036.1 4-hydroxy-tetrahydrodipicolinate reductase [Mangrovivirga cuniculi]